MSERKEQECRFVDTEVHPGAVFNVSLMQECVTYDENSGIPGYPETRIEYRQSFESWFQPTAIIVDDECLDTFEINHCYIQQQDSWQVKDSRIAPHILNARPKIKFPILPPGHSVCLQVTNKTRMTQTFKAKMIGYLLTEEEIIERKKKAKDAADAIAAGYPRLTLPYKE